MIPIICRKTSQFNLREHFTNWLLNYLNLFLGGSLDPFSQDCLDAHNNYRAKHGVPPLMWSRELAEGAQNWADQLASTDSLQHDEVAIQNRKMGKTKMAYSLIKLC